MSARFAMRDCERCGRQVLATADGRCPRCDLALLAQAEPARSTVRLSPATAQPHLCVQCGAPTHRLARVRAVGPRPGKREKVGVPWYVSLVPGIGTLASIVSFLQDLVIDAVGRRRPTVALRVRQCAECGAHERPPGSAPDYDLRRMSFEAHPRFAAALAHQARDARRRQALSSSPRRGDDEARPVSPS